MAAGSSRNAAASIEIRTAAGRDVHISGITLVQRFGAAASKYAEKIQDFLESYLVIEEGPGTVPFGGRDGEFELLDRWLENERPPARFIFGAPAGRGKSALLVRWIHRLQERGPTAYTLTRWNVAFVPISMRFGTNSPQVFYKHWPQGWPRSWARNSNLRVPIRKHITKTSVGRSLTMRSLNKSRCCW